MDESVIEHFEQQQAGTLKLSEAIRIGARMRPQGFGGVLAQLAEGTSCVMHAAYEGIHNKPFPDYGSNTSLRLSNWCESLIGVRRRSKIMWMNDQDKCSREQIAGWLEAQGL